MADITRTIVNGKRHYTDGDWVYPSVTTVLGALDHSHLDDWRDRIGHENADRISREAASRGTQMHELIEHYLEGDGRPKVTNVVGQMLYKRILPLVEKIDNVVAIERFMWSHQLGIAGTVDCIGVYDGVLSIIDFKSSTRPKKEEWIESYYAQCAAYGLMYHEMFDPVKQGVILIANEESSRPQEFIFPLRRGFPTLKRAIKAFKESND